MEDPLPETPPVMPGLTVGAGQLYAVPIGITLGDAVEGITLKAKLLHAWVAMLAIEIPGFTVTETAAKQLCEFMYVMVAVPTDTPVTRPVEFTVATNVLLDVHALTAAGVPEPVSCVVDEAQTVAVPEMVGVMNCAAILKTKLDEDVQLPFPAVTV